MKMENIRTSRMNIIVLACALFAGGCSTLLNNDTLPANAPKGYVEFYAAATNSWGIYDGIGLVVPVYRPQASRIRLLGRVGWEPWSGYNGQVRLRVACAPGKNSFVLVPADGPSPSRAFIGLNRRALNVDVRQDMITPVRLAYTEIPIPAELTKQLAELYKNGVRKVMAIIPDDSSREEASGPFTLSGEVLLLHRDALFLQKNRYPNHVTAFHHFNLDVRIEEPIPVTNQGRR